VPGRAVRFCCGGAQRPFHVVWPVCTSPRYRISCARLTLRFTHGLGRPSHIQHVAGIRSTKPSLGPAAYYSVAIRLLLAAHSRTRACTTRRWRYLQPPSFETCAWNHFLCGCGSQLLFVALAALPCFPAPCLWVANLVGHQATL
jgi:hypothetical protein